MNHLIKPQQPKKFYFLEYFYILLKSVHISSSREIVFEKFVELKAKHNLGESRYKKLTVEEDEESTGNFRRYNYTFRQVLNEAELYGLVTAVGSDKELLLKPLGSDALAVYEEKGVLEFNLFILEYMEAKYQAFRYIIQMCYRANSTRSGLLVLPIYSANKLGFQKNEMQKTSDFIEYLHALQSRLEADIFKYLGKTHDLSERNEELQQSLIQAKFLDEDSKQPYNVANYNSMLKRVRDFWLKYFLQNLYGYEISLPNFELWAYRGKQIGILHITEFYPDAEFNGRIVYPLSVIDQNKTSPNFKSVYSYLDNYNLYLHQPEWEDGDDFVEALTKAYVEARNHSRGTFVRLANVRERVCYNMKMPEYLFDRYLGKAYTMREQLKIRISLEADRLPSETNMDYIHREPVMIEGKYRNIIAIDYNKGQ